MFKELLLWWWFFRKLFKLMWQARSEQPNRAKVRRIIRAINLSE